MLSGCGHLLWSPQLRVMFLQLCSMHPLYGCGGLFKSNTLEFEMRIESFFKIIIMFDVFAFVWFSFKFLCMNVWHIIGSLKQFLNRLSCKSVTFKLWRNKQNYRLYYKNICDSKSINCPRNYTYLQRGDNYVGYMCVIYYSSQMSSHSSPVPSLLLSLSHWSSGN